MTHSEYLAFLQERQRQIDIAGFEVSDEAINPMLFDFQRFCIRLALRKGRFALFEDCGLGKTLQQLEWAHQVSTHTNMPVCIIAPFGVVGQMVCEAQKFGYSITEIDFNKSQLREPGIYITNYEMAEKVEMYRCSGVVLDESSILKDFTSVTKQMLIDRCGNIPYKLACTATPSPNDAMELCNHAEFLNVMSRNEMLAMYFVHDGGATSKWRLKGHCEQIFWDFVSQWAVMLCKPSDIGFNAENYDLPPINILEEYIVTPKQDNGLLFNDCVVSATTHNKELRLSMEQRMQRVADIANASTDNFIIWIKQDAEGDMLRTMIPDAVEVRGSEPASTKRKKLLGFGNNEFRVLITKLKIAQFGLNYQNCYNQIFASLDFSFESTYQGMRRSWRYGQTHDVNIWMVCTDTMQNVRASINAKQARFKKMQTAMTAAMNRNIGRQSIEMPMIQRTPMTLPTFLKSA